MKSTKFDRTNHEEQGSPVPNARLVGAIEPLAHQESHSKNQQESQKEGGLFDQSHQTGQQHYETSTTTLAWKQDPFAVFRKSTAEKAKRQNGGKVNVSPVSYQIV